MVNSSTFYRYNSIEENDYWRSVLFDNIVFPSSASSFNDPFDCVIKWDTSVLDTPEMRKGLVASMKKSRVLKLNKLDENKILYGENVVNSLNSIMKPYNNSYNALNTMQNVFEENAEIIRKVIKIICFTEINNSDLMWSHYAQNHTGYCIECDFSNKDYVDNIKPIKYTDDPLAFDKSSSLRKYIHDSILRKSTKWAYEKEWRLFVADENIITHPDFKNKQMVLDVQSCLTGVYFGYKTEQKYIGEVLEFYKNTSVKIYQMELDYRNNRLVPRIL